MVENNEFKIQLFNTLQPYEYALITDIPLSKYLSSTGTVYDIVIAKSQHAEVVDLVKRLKGVKSNSLSVGNGGSYVNLQMEDGELIIVNLIVKLLSHDKLVLMDEEVILSRRLLSHEGMFVLSIEDQFELATLKSFLNKQGWSDKTVAYFEEFHFLIKEDLVEGFNLKYNTSFGDIYAFTTFDSAVRELIWDKIKARQGKQSPAMKTKKWNNFLVAIRQPR